MSKNEEKNINSLFDKIPFLKKLKTIKHIEIIIFVLFLIIMLLITFGGNLSIFSSSKTENSVTASSATFTYFSTSDYLKETEDKLKTILENIDGAGNVKVMICAKTAGELVYAKNTEEKTTSSGSQKTTITTSNIVMVTKDGLSQPLVLMEILPTISGVVVVADGARNVDVKLNIISAVETILGLPSTAINVFA